MDWKTFDWILVREAVCQLCRPETVDDNHEYARRLWLARSRTYHVREFGLMLVRQDPRGGVRP